MIIDPSPEIDGKSEPDDPSLEEVDSLPFVSTDTRIVSPVRRSCLKISASPLLSSDTKFDPSEKNVT